MNILALITIATAESIYERGLELARSLALDVDSWQVGDPTRSLYKYVAEILGSKEELHTGTIKAGFLTTAEGDWKTVVADEQYNVPRVEATYATPTVTLTNTGDNYYDIDEDGDLLVKCSSSGKTFHNTSTGVLSAGATVTFDLIADEAGSDSSVAVDDIDEIVTTLLDVEVVSSTAATASDQESDDALEERCLDSLGALSPAGPADAYEAVALNSELTGVLDVARARSVDDSDTGDVMLYVATSSGAVAGASLTAVQDAIEEWATPNCITPTAVNASAQTIAITADIEGDDIPADAQDLVEASILAEFAAYLISDGTDIVARSWIVAKIHAAVPLLRVTLTLPAADVTLSVGAVPSLGAVTLNEV